jgi:hypothetical protein
VGSVFAGAAGVAVLAAQGSGTSVAGPLITATASLLGVLVGGFLTGVVTNWREDTREQRLAEAAVRLLHSDLGAVASKLEGISQTSVVWAVGSSTCTAVRAPWVVLHAFRGRRAARTSR